MIFRFVVLSLSLLWACAETDEPFYRKLSYKVGLDCNSTSLSSNFVHVIAEGKNDAVHYIWSTYGLPTVIVARTGLNVSLVAQCEGLGDFKAGSLAFSEPPIHSTALILTEIWEFIDNKDTVSMIDNITLHDPRCFHWDGMNESFHASENMVTTAPEATGPDDIFMNNGALKLEFTASSTEIPSNRYPHLRFNGNSTELALSFLNLHVNNTKSRFAAGLTAVASSHVPGCWDKKRRRSVDDEYSPGVFTMYSLSPSCPEHEEYCKAFVSWKPVAYIGENPTVANSSDATMSDTSICDLVVPESIASAYFGNISVAVKSWNMTFGTSNDGCYVATNYTSWSMMVGIGHPVLEQLSLTAIIVISVGLGMPLLIFIVGAIYMGYRHCQRDGDDLLLEG